MKYILFILLMAGVFPLTAKEKGKMTHVSVEAYGFQGKFIYFNFVEKPDAYVEFPYKEGQLLEVSTTLDDITMLNVNMWLNICLQPGDSLHAKVTYDGRNYKTVEYSGTPQAVLIATTLHKIRMSRREAGYKANVPAALVVLTDPIAYHKESLEEWGREKAILDEIKDDISPRVYNYLLSELDAIFLPNLITYPYACASFQKKQIEECIADDYWTALDNYQVRNDEASLRNRNYMSFLLSYAEYMICKKNGSDPHKFKSTQSTVSEYDEIANFYDGALRDAALFVVLYNALASEDVNFAECETLVKDYLKKYNISKEYKQILKEVMK